MGKWSMNRQTNNLYLFGKSITTIVYQDSNFESPLFGTLNNYHNLVTVSRKLTWKDIDDVMENEMSKFLFLSSRCIHILHKIGHASICLHTYKSKCTWEQNIVHIHTNAHRNMSIFEENIACLWDKVPRCDILEYIHDLLSFVSQNLANFSTLG